MANVFEKELGIPLPQCCNTGDCCKGASPSTPYYTLWKRAADGDEFARGFLSIMEPYQSHEEAEQVVPGLVERTLKAAEKSAEFKESSEVVFYHCRYQTTDNRCGVWEDRPQFCRDYPDTPFIVMAPGCAFEPWAKSCKSKYGEMQEEVKALKAMKQELARLYGETATHEQASLALETDSREAGANRPWDNKIDDQLFSVDNTDNLSLVLSLTRLYVSSPFHSVSIW